ncbi:hypothetical protein V6N11_065515 [Hibiscus sabdariffa]|uniref:Uncharacterized protein n=1 Tax=Hibiscus sabdariffa TaxID=183260 RepID=A0ABR2PHM6_9ROSI
MSNGLTTKSSSKTQQFPFSYLQIASEEDGGSLARTRHQFLEARFHFQVAFYTGVIGAAVTEQLYKEKYWEDHPGEAVPLMKPKFYGGPWKVLKGDVLPPNE